MSLVVALGVLLGLALLAPLLVRVLGRNAGYALAAGFLAVAALLVSSAPTVLADRTVDWEAGWIPSLGVSLALRLDGVSLVFSLVALVVGALVMAYCTRYVSEAVARGPVYPLLALFAAAMVGLVLADDLVLLYVFWEVTTLCSFALVSTAGAAAARPGRQALVVTVAGGLALLVAVVLLTLATGTTRLSAVLAAPEVVLDSPYAVPIAACVALAAFTKSAQFPFQSWLPGAMVAMTPVSAYLHAATMVKAGIYLLIRVSPLFADQTAWSAALISVGLTTALLGAVQALREHDLKGMLARSTVSQLGLLVAVIGVGTSTALAAALLHTVAHALFKATLFMLVGIVDHETGSRDIRELSGLRRVMPWTAAATGIAALSMAGVPPMLGFVSKEYLFMGLLSADVTPWAGPVAGALAVTASALTFAYGARIVHGAFGGPVAQPDLYDPRPSFLAPAVVAAAAGVLLGPTVSLLDPVIDSATTDALPGSTPPSVYAWHGLSPELAMSVVTVVLGLLLFWQRDRVDDALQRLRLPDGRGLFDRAHAGLLAVGGRVGALDRAGSLAAHLARPLLAVVALGAAGTVLLGPLAPAGDAGDPGRWLVAGLLAVSVVGMALARRTLALVALVGVAGLLVALWLLLSGALDVAITLLLVEVLTAVVLVLVLRGRPVRLPDPGPRWLPTAVLALAVGLVAAGATAALTGRRGLSDAGAFYLDRAQELTGGTNVVNTVLVDFRGLDTLLESVVVGVAALGLLLLGTTATTRTARGDTDDVLLRVGTRVLAPGMLALSAWLLWRGHDEPGGGFIAALVAGIAVALRHLATGVVPSSRWLRPRVLVGAGAVLAVGTGLVPLLAGDALLTPFDTPVGISSALLFDVGVWLMVLALVVAVVQSLGSHPRAETETVEAPVSAERSAA
ncbi:hydrogen gas-evolving membrane-bound hydrogenase subunit E [Modestobacter sp. Leaf380]|uniref:hydrogen gas-evolving membrane-bound hydrogenase subunit E n=1 Tax=Modestobacter sp. Leaf380 TaxID=1736356 RepID=UPI0006F83AFE|nr:hydrogen gas-evolving membrane-bound hydrogenase subunit E [Modestobacter sp. Leaf380]KQS68719.1 NADH dehydrogenase [Modestobacter sp. Leaf380]